MIFFLKRDKDSSLESYYLPGVGVHFIFNKTSREEKALKQICNLIKINLSSIKFLSRADGGEDNELRAGTGASPCAPKAAAAAAQTLSSAGRTGIAFLGCPRLLPHSSGLQTVPGRAQAVPSTPCTAWESPGAQAAIPKGKARGAWFSVSLSTAMSSSEFLFDPQGLLKRSLQGLIQVCQQILLILQPH